MTNNRRPLLAITMGDAAGIGPEVVARTMAEPDVFERCCPFVIGSVEVLRWAAGVAGAALDIRRIGAPEEAICRPGVVDILDPGSLTLADFTPGRISPAAGRASMDYVVLAAELAMAGRIDGLATAPIHKEATRAGGYQDIGHLELLARLTGARAYATMLMAGTLRVVHLTTHHSLRRALDLVKRDAIVEKIVVTDEFFRRWGWERPRIGIAALNPHGGESGMFGREEIDEIAPAVELATARGIDARGPFPADSIFTRAIGGDFDAVLAMFHDQGHIPVKVHSFEESVSVAIGLPILRTSVDHGTAFDIAGKGVAKHRSMLEAIRVAADLANRAARPVR
ncbi:MAG: 4-hydroxythreonine-4-phosphate dehydrogenase PdxA [Chloroflexi bacterium]|nr:4-hydroxythreonine-4-phosphate dehydrogenase PdxA [Chloroflexota bacterium]